MQRILVRPLAWQDITSSAEYLELHASFDVAECFLVAVSAEFESLSKMPQIGHLCYFKNNAAHEIRRWPVTGFERWLIFYEALHDGIQVARVLHGAQDIRAIFD